MPDDRHHQTARGIESPASYAAEVTPSDSDDLPVIARSLWIGAGGPVKVTTRGGSVATFVVGNGSVLPVEVVRVHASGTAALGIVALW